MAEITRRITEMAKANEFTVIGDTDHSNHAMSRFLYGPEMTRALREGGVRHVFIEMNQDLQHFADDLAAGRSSRDAFIQNMDQNYGLLHGNHDESLAHFGRVADMVVEAQRSGMKVHFADPGMTDIKAGPTVARVMGAAAAETLRQSGISPSGNTVRDMQSISGDPDGLTARFNRNLALARDTLPSSELETYRQEEQALLGAYNEALDRRLQDGQLADYVTSVAAGQRSAIIYGTLHDDLRDRLTQRGYRNDGIDIYPSPASDHTGDRSDNVAYLDRDQVLSGTADLNNRELQRIRPQMAPGVPAP